MDRRPLGNTGLRVSPIGFGAFKIGRNQGVKYPAGYDLPNEQAAAQLLHRIIDLGINLIDTAPAYGLSEQRIGEALAARRDEIVLTTKAGETFEDGRSTYDFSGPAITASVERSLKRLRTDVIDAVHLHSDGNDQHILEASGAVEALIALRQRGLVRAIGLSGKTASGMRDSLAWADVMMVEYNPADPSMKPVIDEAQSRGVGVLIKKGLASGHLDAAASIRFVLSHPGVSSLLVGSLNPDHMRANLLTAISLRPVKG